MDQHTKGSPTTSDRSSSATHAASEPKERVYCVLQISLVGLVAWVFVCGLAIMGAILHTNTFTVGLACITLVAVAVQFLGFLGNQRMFRAVLRTPTT